MINYSCCYIIISAGVTAKKVLLSVIWYPLIIEINLSQIRISDNKREKVCACAHTFCFLDFILFMNCERWKYGTKIITIKYLLFCLLTNSWERFKHVVIYYLYLLSLASLTWIAISVTSGQSRNVISTIF